MDARFFIADGVPGHVVVVATGFLEGVPVPQVVRSDGRMVAYTYAGSPPQYRGHSLSTWRAAFGGDEGELRNPITGQPHRVSLGPWTDADPQTTSVRFDFAWEPEQPIDVGAYHSPDIRSPDIRD